MRLEGKTALITGGLRGLGRAAAELFVKEGARVFITDIDHPNEATQSLDNNLTYIQANSASEDDWLKVAATIGEQGGLDCLVNNAGIDCTGAVQDVTLEAWNNIMSINVSGPFLGVKHCHALLAKAGEMSTFGSTVINVSSIMGKVGFTDTSPYNTSKGAVTLFTKSIAIEFATKRTPIRVNSLHPGFILTPLFKAGFQRMEDADLGKASELMESVGANTPIGRIAQPDEVASAIVFLASDESSYMTGSEVTVDGGWTAH